MILPVYNGGVHLTAAVDSILAQDHRNLELLAIDDGSTDGSGELLDRVDDPRVRVIHQENRGLVAALNRGLDEARHELVARMDADDLATPDRLGSQLALLLSDPGLVAVGCNYRLIDEAGAFLHDVHVPAVGPCLERQLYFRNILPHGAMLLRRSTVLAVGGYRDVGPVEDYDLWCRLLDVGRIGVTSAALYEHRLSPTGISQSSLHVQRQALRDVRSALHRDRPLVVPDFRRLVSDAAALRASGSGGVQLVADSVFDQAALAVLMQRAGRPREAVRLASSAAVSVLRWPRVVALVPPVAQRLTPVRARVASLTRSVGRRRSAAG